MLPILITLLVTVPLFALGTWLYACRHRIASGSGHVRVGDPRTLTKYALGISILGAVFGLFVLFGAGMSNNADSARRELFVAFVLPVVGIILAANALVVARRCGSLSGSGMRFSSLAISTVMILLTLAVLASYR
jgi:hypothetical protein